MREDGDATYDALVCSGSICDVVSRAADGWWHASWGPFIAHLTGPRKSLVRLQNLLLKALLVIVNTYLYARVGHYRSEVTAERNELLIAKNHPTRSVALQQLAISPQPARASSFDFFLVNFAIVAFYTTKSKYSNHQAWTTSLGHSGSAKRLFNSRFSFQNRHSQPRTFPICTARSRWCTYF